MRKTDEERDHWLGCTSCRNLLRHGGAETLQRAGRPVCINTRRSPPEEKEKEKEKQKQKQKYQRTKRSLVKENDPGYTS